MSDWLEVLPARIGQIFVRRETDGTIVLCHREDGLRAGLTLHEDAKAAREIARFDDAGVYRPLKTAPNLRHGWRLVLANVEQAKLALDLFYPGRAAAYRVWKNGALRVTPLRETLGRQSGMYRVAAEIGDEEADAVVANFCRSAGGCLRTIFWRRDAAGRPASSLLPENKFDPQFDQTGAKEDASPLICQEACNLLVGKMRAAVKE